MGEKVYAVVGIDAQKNAMDTFDNSILLSVLGECGLALDNKRNTEEKEAAAVLAKNEQLRANLLRSISHDLRTPPHLHFRKRQQSDRQRRVVR